MQFDQTALISLVVPVYNAAPWLDRCLRCLQEQTFQQWECILVNDGSTDSSGTICEQWAQRDNRFRMIHQKNGGASSARNTGLDAVRSEFLVFCDADDMTSSVMLEWAWQLHVQYPGDVIVWNVDREFDPQTGSLPCPIQQNVEIQTIFKEQDHAYSLIADYSSIYNKLFPVAVIKNAQVRFDTSLVCYEDHTFMRAFSAAYFEACPQGAYRHLKIALYGYAHENPASLSALAAAEEEIELEAGYLAKVLPECHDALASWGQLEEADPKMVGPTVMHYLTALAYGLYCAHKLGETAPNLWQTPELQAMLCWSKKSKAYTAYYLPFCWRQRWLVRLVYWTKQQNQRLYWKLYEIGYILLGKNWLRF